MHLEERAIVAPSAQVMLVALLVTLARGEAPEAPPAESAIATRESLLSRLAQLSLTDLHRLAEKGALKLIVCYDGDQFAWSLQASARKHTEQALLEYFLRHGAPRTLLRDLFRISRARIEAMRRSLRLAPTQGRPKLPRPREREAIFQAWTELASTGADKRSCYHALHRTFPRCSIAALDAVLREVAPAGADAPPRSGNRPAAEPVSTTQGDRKGIAARLGRTVLHRRAPK